jgi:hypothetical protein
MNNVCRAQVATAQHLSKGLGNCSSCAAAVWLEFEAHLPLLTVQIVELVLHP